MNAQAKKKPERFSLVWVDPETGAVQFWVKTAHDKLGVIWDDARYKGLHGGRGSGKSHAFADLAVFRAAYRGWRILCLREYQKSLSMSVKHLIEAKIKLHGLQDHFDILKSEIRCRHNGGLFVFEGMQAHNAHSIKSFEDFDVAWFEEAQAMSDRSLTVLRPTLRKQGSELWFSWNPEEEHAPVEFLRHDPPPGSIVVEVNYGDNQWITQTLLDEMEYDRRRDPDKFAHVWGGGYRRSSALRVFHNWTIEEFDAAEVEGLSGPYGGADWGFAVDPTVLVRIWVHPELKRIYVDHEAWAVKCKISDTPALFDTVPGARKLRIRADSARPETIAEMKAAKDEIGNPAPFNIVPATKGKGSVIEGVEFLKSYDIVVHPRCRHTIDELTHFKWKADRLTGEATSELEDANNHCIDALRYGLELVRGPRPEFW